MNKPARLIVKADGATLQTLEPGQKAKIEAKASTRYRVLRVQHAGQAEKADEVAQAEALAAQVLASRHGDDLQLDYADGSQLQLEGFFQVCHGAQGSACVVELPAVSGGTQLLGGDSASGVASSGQGHALYAYGAASEMAGLLQAQGLDTEGLQGLSQDGDQISYLPPADGFNWAALASLAAMPLLASASPVPTVIKGSVVAGPVLTGNGLVATAYKADGSVLASGAVNEDGSFTLTVGNDYKGPVLIKVTDTSAGADYFDEATGAPKDLGPDLRALAVVPAPGTYNISVNALTELAVRQLGLAGGDNGTSANSFGGFTSEQIQATNQQVATAVGLEQDLVLGAPAVAIVTVDGESNAQANDYGKLLAAISGAEVGSGTEQVLQTLTQSLSSNAASGEVLEVLLDGAAKIQIAGLVDAVSDITSQKSAQVTIDPVAGDNRLGADEMAAGVTVSGQAAANATVTIKWSDASAGGQPTGSRSVTADAQGNWSTSFAASEMPALGATSLRASVGAEAATRSVYLDAPAAPTIKLHADSGSSASDGLTNDQVVEVGGYVAGWDYSTDGGSSWAAGQGSSFQVSGDGARNVQVRQNVGGHYSDPASLGFTLDTLAPTVAISSDKSALKIGETATITFTLSESGSDFTADDVVVSGGTLSGFTGSGKDYSATFTPDVDSNTPAGIGVASDKFSDAAGNQNADGAETDNAVAISIDTVRPTIEVDSDKTALKAGETATITFTLSEASTDFTADDVTVSGGTLSNFSGSGSSYTTTFTPTADSTTTTSISVASSQFADAAGNLNADGSDANNGVSMSVDTVRPTIAASSDKTALKAGETATITFTLSEASSDFNEADITFSGGTLSGFTGSGKDYSTTFTPTADSTTAGSIGVASAKFADAAGNLNTDGSDANNGVSMSVDTVRPTIAIGSDMTALKAGETATITFTLTEASTDFSADDVVVSGGKLSGFSGSGKDYSATFTPTPDSNAAASVSVASDKFSDAAGNLNTDGSDANNGVSMSVDTVRPTIAVGSDKSALKVGETATITFTLSEASTDFTADDVAVSGGILSGFTGSGTSYSATFTPTGDSTTAASISVASSQFADAAGNQNEDGADSNNAVSISIDTVRPTIAISSDKTALKAGETATITFTLSEASTDFTVDDVAVSGGKLGGFTGSGKDYSATFTPDVDSNTAASIGVASAKFADAAGNQNADGDDINNSVSIKVDTVAPSVASVELSDLALKVGETAQLTVTFSEKVTDFAAGDVTVEAGSLGEFTSQDGGLSWTATLTPTAGQTLDKSKITVGTGYTDLAGNSGTGGDHAGPAVDTLAPTVLSIELGDTALKKGETATVTVTFSEAVQGFAAEDVSALNAAPNQTSGSLGAFTSQDNGVTWTATFTPTDDVEFPVSSLSVKANSYHDAAGNPGSSGSSDSFAIDTLLAQVIQGTPLSTPIGTDGSWATTRYSIGDLSSQFTIFSDPQALMAIQATVVVHRPDGTALEPIQLTGIPPIDFWSLYQSGGFSLADLFPSPVTALADGGFLLTSLNVSNESWEVQRFDARGQPAGAVIELPGVSLMLSPKAVAVGSGFVIAYGAPDVGGDGSHLEMLWLGDAGASKIVVPDSSDAAGISLAALGGGVGLAWTGMGNSWDKKNHFATFDANHDLSSSYETVVTSSTQGFAGVPAMTSLSDGTPLLVWRDETTLSSKTVLALGSAPGDKYTLDNVEPDNEKFLALEGQGDHPPFLLSAIRTVDGKRELFLSRIESLDAPFDTKTELWSYQVPQNSAANWCLSSTGQEGDFLFAYQADGAVTVLRFDSQGKPVGEPNVVLFGLPFWMTSLTATDDGYVMTGISPAHADGVVLHFDATGQLLTGPGELFAVDSDIGLFGSEAATYYLVHNSVNVTDPSDITGAGDGLWNQQQAKKGVFALSTEGLVDGEYRLYALDEAGNFGPASSRSVRVDANAPDVQLTFDQDSLKMGESTQLTVQFSEAVSGFDASDLVVSGGKISDLVRDSSHPLRYSATFTPDADHEGQAKVELAAGLVSDLVGHVNAQNQVELAVDTLRPTIAVSSDKTALKAGETATITFTLSEASSDFNEADITFSGGTLSGFTGSGKDYSATFTPDVDSNTPAGIGVASDKFADAAGNLNADGDDTNNSVSMSVDTVRPTVTISSDKTALKAGETATVTLTLSEASTDFSADDVLVSGGKLSGFTGSGKSYSATFSPDVDSNTPASISVASGKFSDAAGNLNADGADNAVAISVDTQAPSAPGIGLAGDTGSSDSDGLTADGELQVSGLETSASWAYSLDGGSNWVDGSTTTIAASVLGADGAKTVMVRQSDAAGNVSASESISFTLDTTKPATPGAALVLDLDGITNNGAMTAPTNTEAGAQVEYRVKKGDGTFSAWSEAYTAPATDGTADGLYVVEVRQTDAAGNVSASESISFTLDSSKPATPDATLTFDSGSSDSDDISNSGALTAPTNNEAGAKVDYRVKAPGATDFGSWSETYTAPATDGSADGAYQVEVRQTDAAGNVSPSQSLGYTLDTIKPTAAIALGDTALKIGDQSQVTITFSEAVSGLGQESFDVQGGTLSDPVSSDGGITWTASLTPAANLEDASNLVTLKAGTVQDLAGNVIAGATQSANYAIDTIAPPAAVLALHSDTGAPDGLTSDGRVDITGLVAGSYWDYSADGGVSWTPGSGSSITLEDDGTYVVVVRQFDAAGNFSLSQPLTFNLLGLVASPRLGLALHQDTGGSEGVTADGTVDISGLAAGAVWQYSLDGGSTWHAGSETSIPASALGGDGDKSVIVRQVNLFGTVSDNSDPLLFRLDTQAPAAPSLALNLDSGANAGDGLTHDARIDVGGLETGTGWEYSLDNGVSWLAGSGNAIAASALGGDGDKAILVRQTDQAGNVGKEARLSFTLDTSAPTLTGTGPEVDGFQAPGDNLVLHFSEAVVAGSGAIRLVNDDDQTTVSLAVGGAEIGINGATVTIDPASDLLLGKHYHVEIDSTAFTDAAGNAYAGIGDGSSWRFLVPDPAVGLDAIAGDGVVNSAEKTATLNLGGKLSSTGGASVVGAFVAGDFTVTLTPSGGSPVVATITAYDSSTGAWSASIATTGLADDQYTVSVVASHNGLVAEHRSSLLIDTEVATPTLSLAADTGTASGDGITHDALVKVAGLEANASWEYSTDGGSNWQAGVGASFKLAADGSHDLRVRQTDAAGNRSESSAALTVVLDTVAPATPDAMLTASLSDGGAIVAPTHLEAGAMLEYRLKKNGVNVTGSNDGWSQSYAAPAGSPVNAGNYLLEIRQVDVAGNVSASQKLEFMVAGGGLGAAAIAAGEGGFVIDGQTAGAYAGFSVSGAGDVNGDGLADLVVGAPVQHCAYVVFGKTQGGPVDLNAVAAGQGGYMIYPPFLANGNVSLEDLQSLESGSGLLNGFSVSGAGDVNGDGLADVIVGAPLLLGGGYVVYGKSTGTPVNLSSVLTGADGMAMISTVPFDLAGLGVSAAGDVNGDGLADLIVGAPAPLGGIGMAYVVFGGAGKSTINLSSLGSGQGGFVIEGLGASEMSGWSVSGAGDVNGDGLADLVVGAPYLTSGVGQAYVVYGKTGGDIIKLSAIEAGSGGYAIKGLVQGDAAGTSVSGAGDVNGDGLADLIVGSPLIGNEAGASYVVFGRSDGAAVELSAVAAGTGGFVINSQGASCQTGVGVSGAGDVNGDGLADLIIGAPGVKGSTGRSYVVFGHTGTQAVDLSTVALGAGGFAIDGEVAGDMSGFGVSSAGDVNGDGLADLIVGAPYWNDKTGRAYVIFGATDGAFAQTAVDQLGTSDTDVMSDGGVARTLVAGAGDDSLSATAASVLHGGAGNDTFNIGSAMITALQSPLGSGGNDGQLARIDGGSGLDTIALSGAGLTLDLTQVANQAAGDPETGSRLASIERIDLTGGNTLKLTASDIHDLAGMNSFNGLNDWTGLADAVARHQLLVEGGVGDKLGASGIWADLGSFDHGSQTYRRLVQGNAELLVDADLTLDLTIAPGVTGIAFGSASVTQGGFLKKDDWISFEVTFSEAMFFGGGLVPQLALDIGSTLVQANYDSGSGTDKWVFKYAVAAGLTDLDGISIGANAVSRPAGFPSFPAGTIRNASGVDAVFINDPVPANPGWRVDSLAPVAPDATLTAAEDDGGAIVAPTNLEAGATLEYRLKKDGSNVTASNDGWSSSYQIPATNGTYTLELRQTDLAGNASASQKLEFTLGPKYAPVELSAIAVGSGGFVINGQCGGDWSGYSVSSAGDVNGDGLADLIVGAPQADPIGAQAAGRSYVVFGRSGTEVVELSAIEAGSGGFMINGVAFVDQSGHSVSSAGDFNGDGLADLIVGAYGADPTSRTNAGRSYVVFGRSGTGVVELWAVGSNIAGFVINGHCADDWSGYSVSSAGDVNGDGLADLLVGAKNAESGNAGEAGRSYVVFGRSGSGVIELSAVAEGRGGFVINGRCTNDISGTSVSGAGDVNGDGLADLIVGANQADPSNLGSAGSSYVVFGRSGTSAVELSDIAAGTGGFVINGQCAGDQSGYSVSSAGDVNGDGLGDLIVGAYQANPSIFGPAGSSYVVFGRSGTSAVELSDIAAGTGGFVIKGQSASDQSGTSVSSAGDVNGDGLADLIVGATGGDPDRRSDAGRSYVVFGRSAGAVIELSAVAAGSGGFVIKGQSATDQSGTSVSGAGDVNGDGLADLIVGASGADPSGRGDAGRSYVIFGATDGAFAWTAVDQLGGSGVDVMSDGGVARTLVAGAGDDSLTATAASVLHGGAGNDSFTIGSAMITALQSAMGSGGNADRLARIDGGSGLDTIALSGSGLTLDLTRIANQAAGDPETGSRLSSIERIDLSGSGNNQLTLSVADVRDLGGMNLYNSGNGWTGLAASVGKHQLRVDGDAGDLVTGTGLWVPRGTAGFDGKTYAVYDSLDGTAQLLINQAVTAQLPFPTVELAAIAAGAGGFVINGQGASDYSGYSVSSAGDVNGDGLVDLIIGARTSDPTNRTDAGRSYVVFGRTGQAVVELSALGTGGFVINGQCANDWSGASVSGAGDVNGDGLADLIVGASGGDPGNRTDAGRSYVVFGRTATTTIELSALGASGFVINGQGASDQSGFSVSSAGDVNGDGLADLIVGARASDPTNRSDGGRSYVVFGRTGQTAVELSAVAAGTGGFVINGQGASDLSGSSVSCAGDVNGDGLADLIVGAPYGDPAAERSDAGRSYVIFGRTGQTAVELSALGAGGFVINGQCANDQSGMTVSGAGDVNGDGLADLIIGSSAADSDAGRSYVVFGRTGQTAVELSAVAAGSGGFVIRGQCAGDGSGASISCAGDVNGDGLADLIVGAYGANGGAGHSYVVFGRSTGMAIDLSTVGAGQGGFVINGQCAGDLSGFSVSSAGDVNGDGLADLIVGAGWSDPAAGDSAGRSYVIFGSTGGAFSSSTVDWFGTAGADSQSDGGVARTLVAGAGDDSLTATAASVLYGGAGNDSFNINSAMISALQSPSGSGGNVGQLARIDGGAGVDKIVLQGESLHFDLTQITQSAMNPEGVSRLSGIEEIDIIGSGANTIKLTAKDVFDMGGKTNVKDFGWGTVRRELIITGDAGDTVDLADAAGIGGWTADTGVLWAGYNYNGKTYYAYNFTASSNSAAPVVLLVQKDMSVI